MSFKASYIYTIDSYNSLLKANYQRQPFYWLRVVLYIALFSSFVRVWVQNQSLLPDLAGLSWSEIFSELAFYPAFILTLSALFIAVFLPRLSYRQNTRAGKTLNYLIDDDGVSWKRSDGISGQYPWSALGAATKLNDGTALVVWLGRAEGFVLPLVGFSSPDEFKRAAEFVQSKLRENASKK